MAAQSPVPHFEPAPAPSPRAGRGGMLPYASLVEDIAKGGLQNRLVVDRVEEAVSIASRSANMSFIVLKDLLSVMGARCYANCDWESVAAEIGSHPRAAFDPSWRRSIADALFDRIEQLCGQFGGGGIDFSTFMRGVCAFSATDAMHLFASGNHWLLLEMAERGLRFDRAELKSELMSRPCWVSLFHGSQLSASDCERLYVSMMRDVERSGIYAAGASAGADACGGDPHVDPDCAIGFFVDSEGRVRCPFAPPSAGCIRMFRTCRAPVSPFSLDEEEGDGNEPCEFGIAPFRKGAGDAKAARHYAEDLQECDYSTGVVTSILILEGREIRRIAEEDMSRMGFCAGASPDANRGDAEVTGPPAPADALGSAVSDEFDFSSFIMDRFASW